MPNGLCNVNFPMFHNSLWSSSASSFCLLIYLVGLHYCPPFFFGQERVYIMLRMNIEGGDYQSWEATSYLPDEEDNFDDP